MNVTNGPNFKRKLSQKVDKNNFYDEIPIIA